MAMALMPARGDAVDNGFAAAAAAVIAAAARRAVAEGIPEGDNFDGVAVMADVGSGLRRGDVSGALGGDANVAVGEVARKAGRSLAKVWATLTLRGTGKKGLRRVLVVAMRGDVTDAARGEA